MHHCSLPRIQFLIRRNTFNELFASLTFFFTCVKNKTKKKETIAIFSKTYKKDPKNIQKRYKNKKEQKRKNTKKKTQKKRQQTSFRFFFFFLNKSKEERYPPPPQKKLCATALFSLHYDIILYFEVVNMTAGDVYQNLCYLNYGMESANTLWFPYHFLRSWMALVHLCCLVMYAMVLFYTFELSQK